MLMGKSLVALVALLKRVHET